MATAGGDRPAGSTIATAIAASSLVTSLAFVRYVRSGREPRLICAEDSELAKEVIAHCAALRKSYWPHGLHLHWLIPCAIGALKALPVPSFARKHSHEVPLILADGGTISLDWWCDCWPPLERGSKGDGPRPVVLVLPGLGNSSRSLYIRETMARLDASGFQPVALNYRCVEPLPLTSARVAAGDSWHDLPEVLAEIQSTCPGAPIYALAYSMGGTMLTRHLGVSGADTPIRAAVAVSPPLAYEAHGRALLAAPFLSFVMTLPLKKWLWEKRRQVETLMPGRRIWDFMRCGSLHDMLKLIGPVHGFGSPEEYFRVNDPEATMPGICRPLLLISAADDPLIQPVPYTAVRNNASIVMAETDGGGHLGWAGARAGWGPTLSGSWADSLALQFLTHQAMRAAGVSRGDGPSAVLLRSKL